MRDAASRTLGVPKRRSAGTWPTTDGVLGAVATLGWSGPVTWPALWRDLTFAAVHDGERDSTKGPGGGWLVGVVLCGSPPSVLKAASRFAGYCPRSALIRPPKNALAVAVDAALLDVGVVTADGDQLVLLSEPGPVVASPLTERWSEDWRWDTLVAAVLAGPQLGRGQTQSDTVAAASRPTL